MESKPTAEEKQTKEPTVNGTSATDAGDKPKKERRQRKPKTPKDAPATTDGESAPPKDKPKPADKEEKKEGSTEEQKGRKEKKDRPKKQDRPETATTVTKDKPQYRKKGEAPATDDASTPAPAKEEKPKRERPPKKEKEPKSETTTPATKDEGDEGAKKPNNRKKRNNKDKDASNPDGPKEPKYRPKGDKDEENKDEETKDGDNKEDEKEKKDKKEKKKEPDAPKNLVYKNPMDFKEKRKFKSKWEEYRHGDWRKGSGKTFVTIDTEIPETPKELLKPSEEKAFHSKQVEIEDKIKGITSTLDEMKSNFDEILGQKQSQMKAGDTGVVFSKELSAKFTRMSELKKERQVIYGKQDQGEGNKAQLISLVEQMRAKIDKHFNKEEMIPKGIKEAEKAFQTSTGNYKKEQEFMRRVSFLKESVECIKKRDEAEAKLKKMKDGKKEAGSDLPRIRSEMKQLQAEIDVLKEGQTAKTETKETFDKQLDDINAKRKKLRDDRDKLYKQKEELRDTYYGSLIQYTKQQYLLQDIAWMTDMQNKIRVRKEEKDKRDKEYQERKERIAKEREEKKQREEERKQRDIERKQKEIENKKQMEENLKSDEIEKLKKFDAEIADQALGSNPLIEQIELCDQLINFCKKQTDKANGVTEEKAEETEAEKKTNGEIEKALKKGSIQLAPSKDEKMTSQFDSLKTSLKGGRKQKKNRDGGQDGTIDFALIKKFNNLKIRPPINDEDYEKTITDLNELRDALIYWGKIISRQNKIKFIRNARKISAIDEYITQAEEEEKYINNEKSKFDSDETAKEINISLDKLKLAQIIDRENRANKVWKEDSEEEESEEEEEEDDNQEAQPLTKKKNAQVDLYDDDDKKKKSKTKKRRDRSEDAEEQTQVKQTKRPNAQKFSQIMKADDAFPTLENDFDDDEGDDLGDTPAGEINSQE